MSEATRYPVASREDRHAERAERQTLRALKAGLVEIKSGTKALQDGLDGAAIGAVRTTCKEILRRQEVIVDAVISLARLAGGPPR